MWATTQLQMMGTVIDVLIDHQEPEPILANITNRLSCYEKRYSANDSKSELMKIMLNSGQKSVVVDDELFQLIKLGKTHSIQEGSFLNISLGVLTKAWHIGFEDARVPTEKEIQILLEKSNPMKIILDELNHSVYLEEGMSIDLGALAKGNIADLIVRELKEKQVKSGLINLGGNVLTFGNSPNLNREKWHIGIKNPMEDSNRNQLILKIKGKSVVTSGIYERTFKTSGKEYHHIFNPKTGYPIETELVSLTIISEKSVDGEIWTTRLFGYSPEVIIEKINEQDGLDGIVVTKENILYSSGMTHYL